MGQTPVDIISLVKNVSPSYSVHLFSLFSLFHTLIFIVTYLRQFFLCNFSIFIMVFFLVFFFFFAVLDVSWCFSIYRGRQVDVCNGIRCTSRRPVCASRFRSVDVAVRCMSKSFVFHKVGDVITFRSDQQWDPDYSSSVFVFTGYRWEKFSGILCGAGMLFLVETENRQEYWLVRFEGLFNVPTTPSPSTTTSFSTSQSSSSSNPTSFPWTAFSPTSYTKNNSTIWVANSTVSTIVPTTRNNSTSGKTTTNYPKPSSMSVTDILLWVFSIVAYLTLVTVSIIICYRRSRRIENIPAPVMARYIPDEAVHLNMGFIEIPL